MEVRIGTWHQKNEIVDRCPSYYAADTERLRLTPGDYPARLTFGDEYTVPIPRWLLVGLDAIRISGRLYNGFGGANFSSEEMAPGAAVRYGIQQQVYQIRQLVGEGKLTLYPEFTWLVADRGMGGPQTWEELRKVAERHQV